MFVTTFGIVALAMMYAAVQKNTEGRSKAAQEQTILKQWEFNSATGDGWDAQSPNKIIVGNGYLSVFREKPTESVRLLHQNVSTSLPRGLKSMSFSLAVGASVQKPRCPLPPTCANAISIVGQDKSVLGCDVYICKPTPKTERISANMPSIASLESGSIQAGVMCTQDVRSCPDGSYVGRTGNGCAFENCPSLPEKGRSPSSLRRYTGSVYYKLANKKVYEKPLAFSGVADGAFKDVTVRFPEIQGTTIEQMKIVFSGGIRSAESVKIDWIRLLAPGIIPQTPTSAPTSSSTPPRPSTLTPTPSRECKSGVSSFSVDALCSGGYQYMTFACYDGFGRREGGATSCKSSATWSAYAEQYCLNRSNCPITAKSTPTPTFTPIPTVIPHPITWGKALRFANASYNSSHADITRNSLNTINLNTEFTIEFWFKLDDVTPAKQHLFRLADSHLDIFTEKDANGLSRMRIYVADGTNWDLFYGTSGVITKEVWHHFALTYLPTYMGGSFVAYLDGSSGFRNFESSGKPAPFRDSGDTVSVSLSNDAYMGIVSGAVDELRISTIARYPYTSGPGTYIIPIEPFVSDPNTRVLYHFDGTAVDSIGNMPEMSLTNTAYTIH